MPMGKDKSRSDPAAGATLLIGGHGQDFYAAPDWLSGASEAWLSILGG